MPLVVRHSDHAIARADLGNLKDSAGRSRFGKQVDSWLDALSPHPSMPVPRIDKLAQRYSEQVSAHPVADISSYFHFVARMGFTPGGIPTGIPPLAMTPREIRPSNTAIAAIGEALAGWYVETQRLQPIARLVGDGPDFVFRNASASEYALVEVKSTQEQEVRRPMKEAAPKTLSYLSHLLHAVSPSIMFSCWLIGVIIESGSDYKLLSLRIHVR